MEGAIEGAIDTEGGLDTEGEFDGMDVAVGDKDGTLLGASVLGP